MQNLIIGVGVTLLSLIAASPISNCPKPAESNHFAVQFAQMLVTAEPKPSPPSLQDPKARGWADLSIVVAISQPNPSPPALEVRPIRLAKHRQTVIQLGLGEDIDNQQVELSDSSGEYRIFQRYRTSLSIAGEGPHLDLVDWRHFDSPWLPLRALAPGRFQTLRSEQIKSSEFPPTSKAEIVKEVRQRVRKDNLEFLELAKSCRGPNDGSCLVMISSTYLRIQKQVRGRWVDTGLVELRHPMGC